MDFSWSTGESTLKISGGQPINMAAKFAESGSLSSVFGPREKFSELHVRRSLSLIIIALDLAEAFNNSKEFIFHRKSSTSFIRHAYFPKFLMLKQLNELRTCMHGNKLRLVCYRYDSSRNSVSSCQASLPEFLS